MQSHVHEAWVHLLSYTLKMDLSYSPSDCFETMPCPQPDPRTAIPVLEDIGQGLCDARAKYMKDEQVGLTITYNRLKDPAETDPRSVELRKLHEEMDAAVLAVYGWSDIPAQPLCIATDADQKAVDAVEANRLFALNEKRAEGERLAAAATTSKAAQNPGAAKPKRGKKRSDDDKQGSLL